MPLPSLRPIRSGCPQARAWPGGAWACPASPRARASKRGGWRVSSGYYDAYYGRAQRVRTKIAEDFRRVFQTVDFVVTPTSPTVAFKLGERTGDPLSMYYSDYCTVPMSLAGIPALSMPCGLSEGLPVGFQITGPAFSENRLLDVAHALERVLVFDGGVVRV